MGIFSNPVAKISACKTAGAGLAILGGHLQSGCVPPARAAVDVGVFSRWLEEHGGGVLVGLNQKQETPCLVQVHSGRSNDKKTVVVHFNSSDPSDLRDAVSRRHSNMVHVFARNFRMDDSEQSQLVQTGTFFRRLEIPYDLKEKTIREFRRFDVLTDAYQDNCVGPFSKVH